MVSVAVTTGASHGKSIRPEFGFGNTVAARYSSHFNMLKRRIGRVTPPGPAYRLFQLENYGYKNTRTASRLNCDGGATKVKLL
jgi:hypothetical protein